MKVSVIICTLDRKAILPETIPSVERSLLVDELIVVEGLRPVGYARDVGWRKAKNSLICFIDDDEVVPEGWIERLAEEFNDPKIGAVASTIKPLNPTKFNKLEQIIQNHSLKRFGKNARFIRKEALEEIGGFEHIIGGETVYAAQKLIEHGWKVKIVDYPLLHKMKGVGSMWIYCLYRTGKGCVDNVIEHGELLQVLKQTVGSFLRGFQLSIIYKEPLLLVFYPLRCWLYFIGVVQGSLMR